MIAGEHWWQSAFNSTTQETRRNVHGFGSRFAPVPRKSRALGSRACFLKPCRPLVRYAETLLQRQAGAHHGAFVKEPPDQRNAMRHAARR